MYKRTSPPPTPAPQSTTQAPPAAPINPVAAALARARDRYGRPAPVKPTLSLPEMGLSDQCNAGDLQSPAVIRSRPAGASMPATDAGGPMAGIGAPAVGDRYGLPADDDMTLTGLDMIRRFLKLDEIGRDLEAIRKEADARIDAMKTRIAEWFAEQGVETIRVAGYTVYMRRDLWVSYKKPDVEGLDNETAEAVKREAKDRLIESLKIASWEVPDPDQPGATRHVATSYLIHEDYHPSALAALVRELPVDDHGDPMMPPGLKDHIEIYYNIKPCKRKSK